MLNAVNNQAKYVFGCDSSQGNTLCLDIGCTAMPEVCSKSILKKLRESHGNLGRKLMLTGIGRRGRVYSCFPPSSSERSSTGQETQQASGFWRIEKVNASAVFFARTAAWISQYRNKLPV
jgi:hypothetical protein